MGLTSALQVGRTALTAAQTGLQVTGNNMANATTPGYTRQTLSIVPARGEQYSPGIFVGLGVRVEDVLRHVDEAIQQRLRSAMSDERSAQVMQGLLSQLETVQNELSDTDISSELSAFFNAWSELANSPEDEAVRALVVQQGVTLASRIRDMRTSYTEIREQIDTDLGSQVRSADDLLTRIASLNEAIVQAEGGIGTASSLRDQRDALLEELAGYMPFTVVEQTSGAVDILVGSLPVVLGSTSRGIELRLDTVNGEIEASIHIKADGSRLNIDSGGMGALLAAREETIGGVIETLDEFAAALIYEVNRVHSQGQGRVGTSDVTGTYGVDDTTAALDSAAAGLAFEIINGSFVLHVTHEATNLRTSFRIDVDLDGIGTDMSMDDLAAAINAAAGASNVTGAVTLDGRLQLTAGAGFELSFSEDTSGALAALGINTYFTGEDATDIAVNDTLINSSGLLAVGDGHVTGSNGTALAIAGLRDAAVDSLAGVSISQFWHNGVEAIGVQTEAANSNASAKTLVRESLTAQEAAVSGVSLDEESINLLNYQRQYEAAARFIATVDELMQVLLNLV